MNILISGYWSWIGLVLAPCERYLFRIFFLEKLNKMALGFFELFIAGNSYKVFASNICTCSVTECNLTSARNASPGYKT